MSKAEDDNLSELWANLLTDSMSGETPKGLSRKSAALILEQISPEVAKMFDLLAKQEKVLQLDQTFSRLRMEQAIFSTDGEKECGLEQVESDLIESRRKLKQTWHDLFAQQDYSFDSLELTKNELFRLNLIEGHKNLHVFEDRPFQNGYQVNQEGLDAAFKDLQDQIYELVDDRADHRQRPMFAHLNKGQPLLPGQIADPQQFNFRLNALGRSFAQAVSLL